MKFPFAQEVSKHVREKACKFYSPSKTIQSKPPSSTITSGSSRSSSSALTTPGDSIKFSETLVKVPENSSRAVVIGQGLDLIETNFTEILSPTSFTTGADENEFRMIIGDDIGNEEHIVEVSFSCKLCEFW